MQILGMPTDTRYPVSGPPLFPKERRHPPTLTLTLALSRNSFPFRILEDKNRVPVRDSESNRVPVPGSDNPDVQPTPDIGRVACVLMLGRRRCEHQLWRSTLTTEIPDSVYRRITSNFWVSKSPISYTLEQSKLDIGRFHGN